MNGILNFFKPKGMTSHDAVNFIRWKLDIKRVGHTGTLDPNVSGVLPLCIGKATRVSEYILEADKTYIGELTLGVKTASYDIEGPVIKKKLLNKQYVENIEPVLKNYRGEILQVPPMYSALKHKGRKLYELAREGKVVKRDPRRVEIYKLDLLDDIKENKNKFFLEIDCSKGTYIRSLFNDIGEDLGTFGYLSYLIRTKVGDYKIEESYGIETLRDMNKEEIMDILEPMDSALNKIGEIRLIGEKYKCLANGNQAEISDVKVENNFSNEYKVYVNNKFYGIGFIVYSNGQKYLRMRKVLL